MPKVKFISHQKEVDVPAGKTLLYAAAKAEIPIDSVCGGKGTCGKCKAMVIFGDRGTPTAAEREHLTPEEIEHGFVLACKCHVLEDMVVELPHKKDSSNRKTAFVHIKQPEVVEASIEKYLIKLKRPTAKDLRPDCDRLLNSLPLDGLRVSREVLATLPRVLREKSFNITAVLANGKLIAVEPGDTTQRKFGLAVDLGTTTVVGSIVNLYSGEIMATSATANLQQAYGADVVSRITYAVQQEQGIEQLQNRILRTVNLLIDDLLAQTKIDKFEVYELIVVGNTAMSHFFLGVDPAYLAAPPFIPAFTGPFSLRAAELGLGMNPQGRVLVLPSIAGYVGSDMVGVMLATNMDQRKDISLAIDIGTNGEIVLAGRGRIFVCSTAAGPAFEGAQIKYGMRAAEGAIESVNIDSDADVQLKVINGSPPRGICGSGLIKAIAEFLKAGIIDSSGRFNNAQTAPKDLSSRLKERFIKRDDGACFVLAWGRESANGDNIVITQKDIRMLQLSKAAIYAGINILQKEMGISESEINQVFLSGAFGSFIDIESALVTGLLPKIPAERIVSVGNAAFDGALLALISKTSRTRTFFLPGVVEHLELSTRVDFQEEFVNALNF